MTEREEAYVLAERLLDEPNADPDDDLRMLARQLLQHRDALSLSKRVAQSCDFRDEETRKLSSRSTAFVLLANVLTDSVRGCLDRLVNYEKIVGNNGTEQSIDSLMDELNDDVWKCFEKITGKRYVPEVCRLIDWVKHRDMMAARLLEEIMRPVPDTVTEEGDAQS